jgi:hypothetical protein
MRVALHFALDSRDTCLACNRTAEDTLNGFDNLHRKADCQYLSGAGRQPLL